MNQVVSYGHRDGTVDGAEAYRVCVIDGRGGGLGARLVTGLIAKLGHHYDIVGLGTNVVAAEAMRQAGASSVVTGNKPIMDAVAKAQVVVGTLNAVLPGAMMGEITLEIATALLSSRAKKVLLPVNRSQIEVIGSEDQTLDQLIVQSLDRVRSLVAAAAPV